MHLHFIGQIETLNCPGKLSLYNLIKQPWWDKGRAEQLHSPSFCEWTLTPTPDPGCTFEDVGYTLTEILCSQCLFLNAFYWLAFLYPPPTWPVTLWTHTVWHCSSTPLISISVYFVCLRICLNGNSSVWKTVSCS